MSPWVPKFSKLSRVVKPESAPIRERAPSDSASEFPVSGSDISFSYDVESVCASNYTMSDAGGLTNVDDSSVLDSDYAKREGPVNSKSNDADAHSLSSAEDVDLFTDQDATHVALSSAEDVDLFTDQDATDVATKVEQQWNEYSQKVALTQAPHKDGPSTALRKKRFPIILGRPKMALRKKRLLLILGVLFIATIAIVVGILMSTKSSTSSSATGFTYSPVGRPVNPPSPSPDNSEPVMPTLNSQPVMPTSTSPTVLMPTGTSSPTVLGEIEPGNVEQFRVLLLPLSGDDVFDDSTSPQAQAFDWVVSDDSQRSAEEIKMRYVTATLYYSLGGTTWAAQYNFLSEGNVCEWNDSQDDNGGTHKGIFCTNGEITELSLCK